MNSLRADELVRQFSSELLLNESLQIVLLDQVFRYADAERGAALRTLLSPERARVVLDAYFAEIKAGGSPPNLPQQMDSLLARYRKAFEQNPLAFEFEYLDSLEWVMLVMKGSIKTIPVDDAQPAGGNAELLAAVKRLQGTAVGLMMGVMEQTAKSLREKVQARVFSESGSKRALALAQAINPSAESLAAATPVRTPQRTTRPLMTGAQVYTQQCATCHNTGVAGTPKLGDRRAWVPRLQAGLSALVQATLQGKGAMGAQVPGDFVELEISRAVVYLANASGSNFAEPGVPASHPLTVDVRPPASISPPLPVLAYDVMSPDQKLKFGERVYASNCVACHQVNGAGGGPIPALSTAPSFATNRASIQLLLNGSRNVMMPAWRQLSDDEIAAVVNYTRFKFWGRPAEFVGATEVRALRR